jgi:acetyl coenzyme A synthetase (ADP forming)-like protein
VTSTPAVPSAYPSHRIADVALLDGSTVRVRPVLPGDAEDVMALFGRLSPTSIANRFHGMHRLTRTEADYFTSVDYLKTFGLVAEHGSGPHHRLVALASYIATRPGVAECAFVVDDEWQGRGLGGLILEHLAEAAAQAGIVAFEAEVRGGNTAMLEVFAATHLPVTRNISAGVVHLELPTSLSPEALEAFERREAKAAAAGVRAFLEPRSVAVVGASRKTGSIGALIFRNLLDSAFEGPVYPVNPKAATVQAVTAYPTVGAIPGPVDLAVIAVPAPAVMDVARQCGDKGVRALLVISAGFAEKGEAGGARQAALSELARGCGMRIMGPNCLGVMNLDPAVRLNATSAPSMPAHGTVALSSQSGALGIALIEQANCLRLGVSSFASIGNKADISGNDLLEYWEQDPSTSVILMYLESLANPRRFARIARRVAKTKPIVAIKSGPSGPGARAAAPHTGSLAAGEVAVDALFRQAGVIRTDTLEELFEVTSLLVRQPLPRGNRVAIVTNGGGLGILCADACEATGLVVPPTSDATRAALHSFLPDDAGLANPVDLLASASGENYRRALEVLSADHGIDAIVAAFIPPMVTRPSDVAAGIAAAAATTHKTLLACFTGVQEIQDVLDAAAVPAYTFPESAARALGRVARYAAWKAEPEGQAWRFDDVDRVRAASLASSILTGGPGWLDAAASAELLGYYGIAVVPDQTVGTPEEVAACAAHLEKPVAVKIASRTIVQKSDVGGVAPDLATPAAAQTAARAILERLQSECLAGQLDGFVVQEMVRGPGAEVFVGVVTDPLFGPLLACGAGGTLVEPLRDVSVRITPVTDRDVGEMIRSLKNFPVLQGDRGSPELDTGALEELMGRVGLLVEDLPVAELDLNPVYVRPTGHGCVVLDARIRLASPAPAHPRGARLGPSAAPTRSDASVPGNSPA